MILLKNNILKSVLLNKFNTPYNSIPFSKIKPSDFFYSIKEEIKITLIKIDEICSQTDKPSFKNTIESLSNSTEKLKIISGILFNLNNVETNSEVQKTTKLISPILSKFHNDLSLNKKLFRRVKKIYLENKKKLTDEKLSLLNKLYNSFIRNGALLNEKNKKRLRLIDKKLSLLGLEFGENLLSDSKIFYINIKNEKKLSGIPLTSIELAKDKAKLMNKSGWVFSLDYPSYIPFMKFCEDRDLRKKMSIAFGKRGFQKNKNNNENIIFEIIKLRKERANLLGFESHSEFVLKERMAKSEKNVISFLDNLKKISLPLAKKEWKELEIFSKKNFKINKIQKWDIAYVSEKMKKFLFDLDEKDIKPFFQLKKVLGGIFKISKKLYGLTFKINKKIETYHKNVDCYEVYKNNKYYGLFYTDFYPRDGKRNGAWMTSYLPQKKGQRPHVSIVCNFSPPSKEVDSLLSFSEVTTLFHEFGHALHGLLANSKYSSLSGTSVLWDFVELPSQIMENWCYQEDSLKIFAKHYITNKTISKKIIKKIQKVSNFQKGIETIRQLSYSYIDMSFHNMESNKINSIKNHEQNLLKDIQFTPDIKENCISTSFSHIFSGGYSSGYYSYKWAEVLDADAFELFVENGIFNKKISNSFCKNILSKGGTQDPMKLYLKFRGKKPDPKALLRRSGLV